MKFKVTLDGVFNSEVEVEAKSQKEALDLAEKKLDSLMLMDKEDYTVTSTVIAKGE